MIDADKLLKSYQKNLTLLIEERGLTRTEFGKSIGVDQGNVKRILDGSSFPRLDTIIKICNSLSVSPYSLLGNFDESKDETPNQYKIAIKKIREIALESLGSESKIPSDIETALLKAKPHQIDRVRAALTIKTDKGSSRSDVS